MASVVGEQFEEYVQKQINARQKVHGSGISTERTAEEITYLNSKTAWVKLASGVTIDADRIAEEKFRSGLSGTTLAKNYILFGGVARLENQKLTQRGTTTDKNNITDFYDGTYNVTANIGADVSGYSLDFGLNPMPGITSIEVKHKNRGSIREATVKIKVFNREQFDIINVLYLRLGYTVLLEWGNSLYYTNDSKLANMGFTLTEWDSGFFGTKYKTHLQFLPLIEGFRAGKAGNYDGLLGKVKNFTWSFNQDGSYDVELSIISLGDVIESLKCNLTPTLDVINKIQAISSIDLQTGDTIDPSTSAEGQVSPQDNIISTYLLFQKMSFSNANPRDTVTDPAYWYNQSITYGNEKTGIGVFVYPKDKVTQKIDIREDFFNYDNYLKRREELERQYKPYIDSGAVAFGKYSGNDDGDWGGLFWNTIRLEGEIELSNPGGSLTGTNNFDICYFNFVEEDNSAISDHGFYMRLGHLLNFIQAECIPKNTEDNSPLFKIKYDDFGSQMIYYPNQMSFDLRVCAVNSEIGGTPYFPEIDLWKNDALNPSFGHYAYIMAVYVNFTTIENAIAANLDEEKNLAVFPFLSSICTSVNAALGGVNNLEPVMNEETNELMIIDSSYSKDKTEPTYALEMFGYNGETSNFVRNIDLKTEITPEYASMVTIGATAGGYVKGTEATMFSKFNKGIKDRFADKYKAPNQLAADNPDEPRDAFYRQLYVDPAQALGLKYIDVDVNFASPPDAAQTQGDIIDTNVSIATEYFKYLNSKAQLRDPNFASTIIGFIPFNLGITVDGISGVKIYNEVNVSSRFLPKTYPDKLRFIIKGVTHKVTNQDWETVLETVVIPNTLEQKAQYDLLKQLADEDLIAVEGSTFFAQLRAINNLVGANLVGAASAPTPTPSSSGVKGKFAGGGGVKTYGTLGKNGDTKQLSKDALTLDSIDDIVETSGAQNGGAYESTIRSRIVKVAASYVGNQEALPPQNPGWWDDDYEAKFKKLKSYPWSKTQPWCAWFCQLVWKEAYTVGNKLVAGVDDLEYASWYKTTWSGTLKSGALIGSGVSTCKNNFKGISKYISVANAKAGKYIPKPGDIAVYSYGHVDLVIQPFVKDGKLTGYSAIGGNTGDADARNGGETKYYKSKSLKSVLGFCSVITPFNETTKFS
jgi:hypothetical protein